ncbi:MAG TPA: hypothetical protein VI319_03240 [Burkholderiales bacterium]
MPDQDIAITEQDGIIRAVYRGRARYEAVSTLLRDVVRVAAEKQASRILFDLRAADYGHYHVEAVQHAQESHALGLNAGFRIAFLGSPGEPMLRYIETVSINRGYQVRAFTAESEAEGWLRQP